MKKPLTQLKALAQSVVEELTKYNRNFGYEACTLPNRKYSITLFDKDKEGIYIDMYGDFHSVYAALESYAEHEANR